MITTAASNTAFSNTAPGNTAPGNTAPGNTAPSSTAFANAGATARVLAAEVVPGAVTPGAPMFRIPAPGPREPEVVAARPSRGVYLRRRALALLLALVAASALVLFGEAMMAEAGGGVASTGGHAVIEPGQTLWQVALDNAPADADPRAYLQDLKELNGLSGAEVAAWTVVLLPR